MKASKEHKPQQSRVIQKHDYGVIQKQAYDSVAYYNLFREDIRSWIDGNRREFFLPTRQREPHIHAYKNGVVLTCIGHNHRHLTDINRNINIGSVGEAKDIVRTYIGNRIINANDAHQLIGGLNILINLSKR